jgi:hypothetical protein
MQVKRVDVKFVIAGRGVAGFNGRLNSEEAKTYHVADAEVLKHDNFVLPNFVIRNGKAHLKDSSRHVKSKLAMENDCRQQVISYLSYTRDKNVLLTKFLASNSCLTFGYLATRGGAGALKRTGAVSVSSLIDKNPTQFSSETGTRRCGSDKTNTLFYTVTCEEVEMCGDLLINLSELSYVPVGNERDRCSILIDNVEDFKQELKTLHKTENVAGDLKKYVRKTGTKDIAETALILTPEVVANLVRGLLQDVSEIEYHTRSSTRKFKEMVITAVLENNETVPVGSKEELDQLLKTQGIWVNYEENVGRVEEPTPEEKKEKEDKEKARKEKAATSKKPSTKKAKDEAAESEE